MTEDTLAGRDIIVVGASAGGVEALIGFARCLPRDLAAAVFVVLHLPSHANSVLPQILDRAGLLPAARAVDGERIEHGRIYVAPPDFHLLVEPGRVRLSRGPRENHHRPAVDPLFRSAARFYGPRVVGVVLSGTLDDGASGTFAVKMRGGVAMVQDPDEALFSSMPESAARYTTVDWSLPVAEMGPVLARLAAEPVAEEGGMLVSRELEMEAKVAAMDAGAIHDNERPGTPSGFACPECSGALWELQDGDLVRCRCRTGHAFTANTLLADQSIALEDALWTALRALEEQAALAHRLADRSRDSGHLMMVRRFEEQERDATERAEVIRRLLVAGPTAVQPAPEVPLQA